ncbi:MAG TPA: transposase zinc-binding domain-containing protein [candidate division Zixibacteria bacterium]|nr:transposase zinc-binding domain-containing protein [candidate division Zixibacteria bacterium]
MEIIGGHAYHCDHCDEDRCGFRSCLNLHCPKCQHDVAEQWLAWQQDFLLPMPYFLLTFTLPAGLRASALYGDDPVGNGSFSSGVDDCTVADDHHTRRLCRFFHCPHSCRIPPL